MSVTIPGIPIQISAAVLSMLVLSMLVWQDLGLFESCLGFEAFRHEKYADAARFFTAALKEAEKSGPNNHAVAVSLVNVALVYDRQHNYAEAEPILKRALAINQRPQCLDLQELSTNLNNLGMVYSKEGNYAKAEPLLKRALAIRDSICGNKHEQSSVILENLADVYRYMGEWAKAKTLYKQELLIREQALGSNDSSLTITLNALGIVCGNQGQYTEAEGYYTRAIAIHTNALGKTEGPATSLSNLASLYDMQGKYADALPLYKRSLTLYEEEGRYAEAEPLCKRALAIMVKAVGSSHRDEAAILDNYATILRKTGRSTEADDMEARVKAIRARKQQSESRKPLPVKAPQLRCLSENHQR